MIFPVLTDFNNNIKIIISNQCQDNSYIYVKYFINNVFGFNNEIINMNDNICVENLNLIYFGDITKPCHSIVPYFLRNTIQTKLDSSLKINHNEIENKYLTYLSRKNCSTRKVLTRQTFKMSPL